MSIHHEKGKWRVKYRVGGRQRSRTFDRKSDARTFDAELTRHGKPHEGTRPIQPQRVRRFRASASRKTRAAASYDPNQSSSSPW